MRDFLIRPRNDVPHSNRHQSQPEHGERPVNRVQSRAKLAYLLRQPVPKVSGEMPESFLHPPGYRFPTAPYDDRDERRDRHDAYQEETAFAKAQVILRMRN